MRIRLFASLPVLIAGLALTGGGCGKKADSDTKVDVASADERGGPPPVIGRPNRPNMGGPGGPGGGAGNRVEEVEPHLVGKKTFNAHCANCHSVSTSKGPGAFPPGGFPGGPPGGLPPGGPPGGPGGPGGPPGGPGGPGGPPGGFPGGPGGGPAPSLAKIGANPEHSVEWLSAFIRDPRSKHQHSRMPGFGEEKINAADLKALSEYLITLK